MRYWQEAAFGTVCQSPTRNPCSSASPPKSVRGLHRPYTRFDLNSEAATRIVTSNADDGAGSLRQAIVVAVAGDTINFVNDMTITLTSGELLIDKNLTIDGVGHAVTVSGNSASRVFTLSNGVTGALLNLAVINGYAYDDGGIYSPGTLTLTNVTLSGNSVFGYGGGVYNGGTLMVGNTVLANSVAGGDCVNDGSIIPSGVNWVEDGSCTISGALTGDPLLGPLANNGGPTQTMALLAGSPAINAGDNTICAAPPVNGLDQRGVKRPQELICDIGAFEWVNPLGGAWNNTWLILRKP